MVDFFKDEWSETEAISYSIWIVTVAQAVNIGVILGLLENAALIEVEKWQILILMTFLYVINLRYYKKYSYNDLKTRWINDSPKQSRIKGWLVVFYFFMSGPGAIIGAFIYHGIFK